VQGGKNQVTGETGVDGDARRLHVSNFPDHDDVGRLAQHGTECRRESHSHICIHLNLVDPVHLVFHRILNGDDLTVRTVDGVQTSVKRSRFARPGGAGDKQNAIGQLDELLECCLVVTQEPQLWQPELEPGLVENTHDDTLTMVGRDGRNAQIQLALADLDLNTSVLGQALLGDAHGTGHDLETADDGVLKFLGRALHFEQHAVHAEPHAKTLLQRFEVNVAGPHLVGFQQHHPALRTPTPHHAQSSGSRRQRCRN